MDYKKNLSAIQHEKLKVILSDLPAFCRDYFDYCDGTLNRSTATMLEYAYDVRPDSSLWLRKYDMYS